MTALSAERADELLAHCQAAGKEVGNALSAAFGGDYHVQAAEPGPLDDVLSTDLRGPGLRFEIKLAASFCLATLPQTELMPAWCAEADAAGQQKLDRLGADLSAALFASDPEQRCLGARFCEDLGESVNDEQLSNEAVCLPLTIGQGEAATKLLLIWPIAQLAPTAASGGNEQDGGRGEQQPADERGAAETPKLPKHRRLIYRNLEEGIRQLPAYAQSLLRVRVPVTVTLAQAKTPVSRILEMGPGTMLQFPKACDSNLTLEVGRQAIAEGEAVKVGDKFGLWITSMRMPDERFWSVANSSPKKRVR